MKLLSIVLIVSLVACGGGKSLSVKRLDANTDTDLSGYWNDGDSRRVSEEMIKQVLNANWLGAFTKKEGRKPIVVIEKVTNKTSEHLNTKTFIKDMERQLVNAGTVRFVAGGKDRNKVRSEKMDQQTNANFESAKELGNETAADYMLLGEITSITDQVGGKKVIFYQVNLELVDIETNEKVWIGDKKIKKFLARDSYKLKPQK